MADREPQRRRVSLYFEQYGPIFAAVSTLVALGYFAEGVVGHFASGQWKASDLYSAVFDWAAIQTGFAFGVYGFIAGKQDGFVRALQGTIAMGRFISYVKRANIAGFLLSVTSIPLIVLGPEIIQPWSIVFILVVLWFSLFIWAFCAFLRLAYNFGQISSVKDRDFHGA